MVEAIRDRTQAPDAVCAQSVLGAASLVAQARADVELPTGEGRPLSLFLVTVAQSGERKSAADAFALAPVAAYERELVEANRADRVTHEHEMAAWKAQQKDILADKKSHPTKELKQHALADLGPPPTAPLDPQLVTPEPTYEGLVKLFGRGRPALGLFSDEGGQFIGGYGMSADNRLKTSAALSKLWDNGEIRRVRGEDGSQLLFGRRLALHLMLQPKVSTKLLADPELKDQGLLSRILAAAPESTAGTRFWREPKPESDLAIARYRGRILDILRTPLELAVGPDGQPIPNELALLPLELGPEARRTWIEFVDHIEGQIGAGGALAPVRGLAGKAPEHAARIAAVLAVYDDHRRRTIPVEYVDRGIQLVGFYLGEALRLHGAAQVSIELEIAETTRLWLAESWPQIERDRAISLHADPACSDPAAPKRRVVFGLPDLYQYGPAAVRDAATAEGVANILVTHGWAEPMPGGAVVAGCRRKTAWRVVGL